MYLAVVGIVLVLIFGGSVVTIFYDRVHIAYMPNKYDS